MLYSFHTNRVAARSSARVREQTNANANAGDGCVVLAHVGSFCVCGGLWLSFRAINLTQSLCE